MPRSRPAVRRSRPRGSVALLAAVAALPVAPVSAALSALPAGAATAPAPTSASAPRTAPYVGVALRTGSDFPVAVGTAVLPDGGSVGYVCTHEGACRGARWRPGGARTLVGPVTAGAPTVLVNDTGEMAVGRTDGIFAWGPRSNGRELALPAGAHVVPVALTRSGRLFASGTIDGTFVTLVWQAPSVQPQVVPVPDGVAVRRVNDAGQFVGVRTADGVEEVVSGSLETPGTVAVVHRAERGERIGNLFLTESGYIAGDAVAEPDGAHAFLMPPERPTASIRLPYAPSSETWPLNVRMVDVDERGVTLLSGAFIPHEAQWTTWDGTQAEPMPTLPAQLATRASGLNDRGEVAVGAPGFVGSTGVIAADGTLAPFGAGHAIGLPVGLTDSGEALAGWRVTGDDTNPRPRRWTPVGLERHTSGVVADTYLNPQAARRSFAAETSMAAGGSAGYRALIRVRVPEVAQGRTVTAALLHVTASSQTFAGSNATFEVHRVVGWDPAAPNPDALVVAEQLGVLGPLARAQDATVRLSLDTSALVPGTDVDLLIVPREGTAQDSLWLWSREAADASSRPSLQMITR